jgi:hypothetical protein
MGSSVGNSRGWSNINSGNALFGDQIQSRPKPLTKFPISSGQRTMPIPGAPKLPMNPFPEIARRRIRMGLF